MKEVNIMLEFEYNSIGIISECLDDFSSKEAMENNGWVFEWNDQYVFRPGGSFCNNVPTTSYCGFRYPGEGVISYTFPDSGKATLSYGHSWNEGSVHVFMNDEKLESLTSRGTSDLSFSYSAGDKIQIKEYPDSVMNIHSFCISSEAPGIQ